MRLVVFVVDAVVSGVAVAVVAVVVFVHVIVVVAVAAVVNIIVGVVLDAAVFVVVALLLVLFSRVKILRLLCIGEEVRASEEEEAAATASAAATAAVAAAGVSQENGDMTAAEAEGARVEEAWRAAGGRKVQQLDGTSRAQFDFGW